MRRWADVYTKAEYTIFIPEDTIKSAQENVGRRCGIWRRNGGWSGKGEGRGEGINIFKVKVTI